MGNKPEARFAFIQENAAFASADALDIRARAARQRPGKTLIRTTSVPFRATRFRHGMRRDGDRSKSPSAPDGGGGT